MLLCLLLFATHTDAFSVFLKEIAIGTTKEFYGYPEVYLECDVGEKTSLKESLDNVNEVNVVYVANPPIYIDRDLGFFDEHECVLYESDKNLFDIGGRGKDDVYGYFTVSRKDFKHKKTIIKYLPGEIAITLGCYQC